MTPCETGSVHLGFRVTTDTVEDVKRTVEAICHKHGAPISSWWQRPSMKARKGRPYTVLARFSDDYSVQVDADTLCRISADLEGCSP
jgi:hypothetical protein